MMCPRYWYDANKGVLSDRVFIAGREAKARGSTRVSEWQNDPEAFSRSVEVLNAAGDEGSILWKARSYRGAG